MSKIDEVNPEVVAPSEDELEFLRELYDNFILIREHLEDGVSGSFTTTDGKTVTVTNGIITNIV